MENFGSSEKETRVWSFLTSALLGADEKDIILLSHAYYNSDEIPPSVNTCKGIVEAYNSRGSSTPINTISANFNSGRNKGKVICWIAGHTHKDMNVELSDGTPVIITTTCNAGAETGSLTRTAGTENENAFDVFSIDTTNHKIYVTRIGAGTDREFTYTV